MESIYKEKAKILVKNLLWDIYEKKQAESKYHFPGNISTDTAYMIFRDEYNGLFSYVEMCMRYVSYAIEHEKMPIIDMTGCRNPYVKDGDESKVNWWNLYFDQPLMVENNLSDYINIQKCEYDDSCGVPYGRSAVFLKKSRWYWGKIYEQYFHLNKESEKYVENDWKKLFGDSKCTVLGVKVRGTDYKVVKHHPIQPSVDQVIKEVKKVQSKFDKILVESEEYANIEIFKKAFPGKVIANEDNTYFDVKDANSADRAMFEVKGAEYQSGLEYLASIMLLSKCDGLIGGVNGGTIAATYINGGKYRYNKLIYLGVGE